jgi:cutinase
MRWDAHLRNHDFDVSDATGSEAGSSAAADPLRIGDPVQNEALGQRVNVIERGRAGWACRLVADLGARRVAGSAGFLGAAMLVAATTLLTAPVPSASAQPCPEVEVVFARGTGELPGVGNVGQAFVDSLRWQLFGRSVGVYAVNYPASSDFAGGPEFTRTVVDGVRDAAARVEFMAAACPDTKIVLGGYSQGAVVAGFATSAAVPEGLPAEAIPPPLPPETANHVAAVALFGTPAGQFMHKYGAPDVVIGPLFAAKTIELCAPGDLVCSAAPDLGPNDAHLRYPVNGMVGEAATFAATRLS